MRLKIVLLLLLLFGCLSLFDANAQLTDSGKMSYGHSPQEVAPSLNSINFDDLIVGNDNSDEISPNRYAGVSFYRLGSQTYLTNFSSYSYPNSLAVGNSIGFPDYRIISPGQLMIEFSGLGKDVAFRWGNQNNYNSGTIAIYGQSNQLITSFPVNLFGSWNYFALNAYSTRIKRIVLTRPSGSYQPGFGHILLDNFEFTPITTQQPIGNFGGVDLQSASALGWSLDPDDPSASNLVDCYIGSNLVARVTANLPSPDVPHPGSHRFSVPVPSQYRDGNTYSMNCYGLDVTGGDDPTLLSGSPRTFRFNPPIGFQDNFLPEGIARGWSLDPDLPQQSNIVHFYVDGQVGAGGTFIGEALAGIPRPDVNLVTGYPGNHGYEFSIPAQYRDGQNHTLYAYGIDLSGDHAKLLSASPKTFNLTMNVTSVTFEEIAPGTAYSIPLGHNPLEDDDGGTDEGLRVFPDDDVPNEGGIRQKIRVKAHLNVPIENRWIYFRNFDMDDPSVYSDVDPDIEGNDNRGVEGGGAGIFSWERGCQAVPGGIRCRTNSEGVASVNFTVTMQPGDNFAVAASTSESEINSVGLDLNDGLHLRSASAPRVFGTAERRACEPSDKVCRSRLLTVWRRLHIETDRMPAVSGNFVEARVMPSPPRTRGYRILAGETKQLNLYDPQPEGGRFENGLFVLGFNRLPITASTDFSITVTNTTGQEVFVANDDTFFLYDDDDFNNNDGANLTGDNGEAIPLPDLSLIPEGSAGDIRLDSVLALAYIRLGYYNINSVGNGLAQQFKANLNADEGEEVESIISFDNRTTQTSAGTDQDPRFWTIYLLNAYQGREASDWDPRSEVNQDLIPEVSYSKQGLASFVFVEPSGSKECTRQVTTFLCNISTITAREVARALGAEGADEGLLDLRSNVLSSPSLRKIRQQTVP